MKNMRMVLSALILAGLLSLAFYAGFIALRGRGGGAATDLTPEQLTAQAAQAIVQAGEAGQVDAGEPVLIPDSRFVDNTTVTMNVRADLQMVTNSEQAAFAQIPSEAPTQDTSGQAAGDGSTDQAREDGQQAQEAPTNTPVPDAVVTTRPAMIITTAYVVADGDSLYRISLRKDTSIALMAQYNIDAANIVVGATIQLPIVNPEYCSGYRDYHLVLEGDNVFRIADTFGTTREAIRDANQLDENYTIKTNNVLCIP